MTASVGSSIGRSTIGGAEGGWWARERARFVLERLQQRGIGGGVVVDIGCGRGEIDPVLATDLDAFVVGCDGWVADTWANVVGRCAYLVADAGALPLRPGCADLVTAFDVIEHFEDDHIPLRAMAALAAPDGHVCITVPADPKLWSPFDEQVGHFRRYVENGLVESCERAGLRGVDRTHFFAWLVPPAWALRRRTRHDVDQVDGGVLTRLVDRFAGLLGQAERAVLRRRRLHTGTSLWWLGRVDGGPGRDDQTAWSCPVCGRRAGRRAFRAPTTGSEAGVDAEHFVPAAAGYGTTVGEVRRCVACGHGSLATPPTQAAIASAYAGAADVASIREEAGQVATARRDLDLVLRQLDGAPPGRLVDVGCWTGSLLVAAREAGWAAEGIEPSGWATARARERGLDVRQVGLGSGDGLAAGAFQVAVACDVLEHLLDPAAAVARLVEVLEPGGALLLTVPDAGSLVARAAGRRWWSVLPMHVQYFSRRSMVELLTRHGLEVRTIGSHAKLFSRRYYAERLGGYLPVLGPALQRAVDGSRGAEALIGPDLHDRLVVVAVKRIDR